MALTSPGVEITVIDESNYTPSDSGTVASILIATAQDKTSGTGSGTASGTTSANAGKTFLIGSQRELTATFGNPTFHKTAAGSPINGFELNEYGLLAAYSMLGVTNRAYVTRADIDLSELSASTSRPVGNPTNNTIWWDVSTDTRWGIFEWNQSTGVFTRKVPTVITSTDDLDGGVPKTSIGAIGDYAVVTTNTKNPVYFKNRNNAWALVGGAAWQISHATISGTVASPRFTNGNTITINGTTVTMSGSTVTELKNSINTASITGVTADVVDNKIQIFANSTAVGVDSVADGKVVLANASGTILSDAGLTAGTYARPIIAQDPHYTVPAFKSTDSVPRPTGSIWIKTTSSNLGFLADVSKFDSSTATFVSGDAPAYTNDQTALFNLDKSEGGLNIAAGSYYVQYDADENDTVTYRLYQRFSSGILEVTGNVNADNPITAGNSFTIQASQKGTTTLTDVVSVTTSGTTIATMSTDINGANVSNVSAEVTSTGFLKIKHDEGGIIIMKNTSGTPLTDAGIVTTLTSGQVKAGNNSDIILSNWIAPTYTASTTAPSANPTNDTYWYHGGFEADIMIHDGTIWKGYQNITDTRGFNLGNTDPDGVIFSTTAPTTQSDETALVNGDLWIDTSDLENYPVLYRRETVDGEQKWVLIDKTDSTTEDGIIFGDARFMGDGTTDVITGTIPTTKSLLSNDYLDIDRPDPTIYPRGMLLFNTRRSSYNVKQFKSDYFSRTNFASITDFPSLPTEKDAWVTSSGSTFGRKSQRNVVVAAMKSAMDSSTELREDARTYNLIAAPGYPELIANMVSLNNDRRNTAFVIGDTPMRLSSTSTAISNYATNSSGSTDNDDDGLVTSDANLAVFYPSGTTNDLSGNTVVVPPSHAMLRTITRSDEQAFEWFAPAGTRRGLIDNITAIGFINSVTGAFVTDNIRESIRDTLYSNRINPISFFQGSGILNYGNKTRATTPSALDRINVSRLIAFLRNSIQETALSFVFEPNDKITRDELKQQIEQTLNDIVAKRGIFDYLVVCDETNNTSDRIDRNELYVDIAIEPTKATEFIFIPIRLKNTGEIAAGNVAVANSV